MFHSADISRIKDFGFKKCPKMSSQSQTIEALGRPFDLGMLYDRRSEVLIHGKTLWSPDHLSQAVKTISIPYTNSELLAEDIIDAKASALNVEFPCGFS